MFDLVVSKSVIKMSNGQEWYREQPFLPPEGSVIAGPTKHRETQEERICTFPISAFHFEWVGTQLLIVPEWEWDWSRHTQMKNVYDSLIGIRRPYERGDMLRELSEVVDMFMNPWVGCYKEYWDKGLPVEREES